MDRAELTVGDSAFLRSAPSARRTARAVTDASSSSPDRGGNPLSLFRIGGAHAAGTGNTPSLGALK
jgi:hypothetical protein